MALSLSSLESDIKDAFQAGMDGASTNEAAQYLAFAILAYAAEAEVLIVPGTIWIPSAPPVLSSANGQLVKSSTYDLGKNVLWSTIESSFIAQEPTLMGIISPGIVAYALSSLTTFTKGPITVTGASVMPPPALATIVPAGLAGASLEQSANLMATLIHAAFKTTTFTGACIAPDGGVGPVVGLLI